MHLHVAARTFARSATLAVALLVIANAPANGQVSYRAGEERVPDFGRFVPERETRSPEAPGVIVERVSTAVPWSRGMVWVDGELVVISRGRHRGDGGVSRDLEDRAGTLWRVDPSVSEPVVPGAWAGAAVRTNAEVLAEPSSPPFHLYDRSGTPEDDLLMARPYCALAWDEASRNLFVCGYAGAELPTGFRKHATDAVYRYDLRTESWHVVEQHDPDIVPVEQLGRVISNAYYPHHDPDRNPPPHGWLNGPNGCVAVGRHLYVPAKDNHLLVQYDLDEIRRRADAPPPPSRPALGPRMLLRHPAGTDEVEVLGVNSVAPHGDHLYVGFRTSSIVVRLDLDAEGDIGGEPGGRVAGDLIAVFEPWDPETKRSGNLYDLDVCADGVLYVSLGREGRIWRIEPDPARPFYGNDRSDRPVTGPPFLDLGDHLGRPTGCNNVFAAPDGWLYVSSRADDTLSGELRGTIYRARLAE